jgi:hypothetical protein
MRKWFSGGDKLSSRKIVLVFILVLLAATGFTLPGLVVSKTAHKLQPPMHTGENLIADLEKGNVTLTQLEEGKATPLGGSGQVVFQYYGVSTSYWQRGAAAFLFSYTVKSNWYADLAITVRCIVGEKHSHGFITELEAKNSTSSELTRRSLAPSGCILQARERSV